MLHFLKLFLCPQTQMEYSTWSFHWIRTLIQEWFIQRVQSLQLIFLLLPIHFSPFLFFNFYRVININFSGNEWEEEKDVKQCVLSVKKQKNKTCWFQTNWIFFCLVKTILVCCLFFFYADLSELCTFKKIVGNFKFITQFCYWCNVI